jgi:hypothetical protein
MQKPVKCRKPRAAHHHLSHQRLKIFLGFAGNFVGFCILINMSPRDLHREASCPAVRRGAFRKEPAGLRENESFSKKNSTMRDQTAQTA